MCCARLLAGCIHTEAASFVVSPSLTCDKPRPPGRRQLDLAGRQVRHSCWLQQEVLLHSTVEPESYSGNGLAVSFLESDIDKSSEVPASFLSLGRSVNETWLASATVGLIRRVSLGCCMVTFSTRAGSVGVKSRQ